MPSPLEIITTPAKFGARTVFGAARGATGLLKGALGREHEEPPPRPAQAKRRGPQRRSSSKPKPLDDVAITRKVESVIFREESVDKGKIDVNTADAVVWLRGEAKTPEQIKQLEAQARAIPEVKQVENLLHLPHTPAPTRADTPEEQQATRRSNPDPTERKVAPTRTTAERQKHDSAEPAPREVAESGGGRPPAPLGSDERDRGGA